MSFLDKIKGRASNDRVAADAVSTTAFADAMLPAHAPAGEWAGASANA